MASTERSITLPADQAMTHARSLARLLDNAVSIPGTGIRLGLDPLLGLVPGLGDLIGAGLSGYVMLLSARAGAPPSVLLRMLANVAIDTVGGILPVVGDVFDAAWKSNIRNVELLERHLADPVGAHRSSRLVIGGLLGALGLVVVAGVAAAGAIVYFLIR